uniref:DDE Tnp4 domain-containing protein n=1 Tax=Magallana gigas TaxID=29159 RepID=A0A8W8M9G3_MAGGI
MQRGYLHPGDSIMADKVFRIEDKLAEMGLKLNIPPFATSAHSMSAANVTLTRKIAAHRIHVEKAINQIKCVKLFSRKIPVSLLHTINEYWALKQPWLKLAQAEFLSLLVYATVEANLYMEVQQGPHSIQAVYNAVQCTPTLWHEHKSQKVYS